MEFIRAFGMAGGAGVARALTIDSTRAGQGKRIA